MSKNLNFLGQVAHTQCTVVAGALCAPVIIELGNRLCHTDAAVGVTNVQNVAGNDLSNGVDQLEGLFCTCLTSLY